MLRPVMSFMWRMRPNAGLQLRRAITIQAEGIRLLEKHAIAPSAARLCFMKGCQEKKHSYLLAVPSLTASHNLTRKPFNFRRQGSFLPSSPQQLLEIFLSDRGLTSSRECRPLFYLRLRLNSSLRLLLSQVVPGGIQLCVVLRCGLVSARYSCDTKPFDTFPEPVFSISSCWDVVFLCSAGWSLSSL